MDFWETEACKNNLHVVIIHLALKKYLSHALQTTLLVSFSLKTQTLLSLKCIKI